MPILIDGHNLIGQIEHLRLSDPDDEAQLVLLLRSYAQRKRGRRVVVVFDHGVYGHPDNLNGYGVECHFAKSPKDADRELIRRIRAIRQKDRWRVVSSDRAVAGEARAHGITVMSSRSFAHDLMNPESDRECTWKRDKDKDDELYKHRPPSQHEVEEWLRLFGEDPSSKEN